MMSSQLLYESINPTTYLKLAQELESRSDMASKRTAADRVYYAAFLTSRDQLASKDYLTPYYDTQDHQYVTEALKKWLGTGVGNDENRLRRARNCINYDTRDLGDDNGSARTCKWMIRAAEKIITKVESLPRRPQN